MGKLKIQGVGKSKKKIDGINFFLTFRKKKREKKIILNFYGEGGGGKQKKIFSSPDTHAPIHIYPNSFSLPIFFSKLHEKAVNKRRCIISRLSSFGMRKIILVKNLYI